jgi:hypothetical protein
MSAPHSVCCNDSVRVGGNGSTHWYICNECDHPCDVLPQKELAHLSHCYQNQYLYSCKYGDNDCPMRKDKMKLKIEMTSENIAQMILRELSAKLDLTLKESDIKIFVRSKQNFRDKEWEIGEFKVTYEGEV